MSNSQRTTVENQAQDPLKELAAMKAIAEALKGLERDGVSRVLRWAADAFGAKVPPVANSKESLSQRKWDVKENGPAPTFGSLADLYAAASPAAESDRALVIGYWFQIGQGEADFDSQAVNKELKHLGYGVGNITQAFSGLMARKPQLVIQTRKSGTSQQARKRYKLTTAGIQAVEKMLGKESVESTTE